MPNARLRSRDALACRLSHELAIWHRSVTRGSLDCGIDGPRAKALRNMLTVLGLVALGWTSGFTHLSSPHATGATAGWARETSRASSRPRDSRNSGGAKKAYRQESEGHGPDELEHRNTSASHDGDRLSKLASMGLLLSRRYEDRMGPYELPGTSHMTKTISCT